MITCCSITFVYNLTLLCIFIALLIVLSVLGQYGSRFDIYLCQFNFLISVTHHFLNIFNLNLIYQRQNEEYFKLEVLVMKDMH